jgi:acylphosphatase
VNLEKALRFGDRLGGHLVSGHVDGVGTVAQFHPWARVIGLEVGRAGRAAALHRGQGSITVDGVSLTVNELNGARFRGQPDSAHARSDYARAHCGSVSASIWKWTCWRGISSG